VYVATFSNRIDVYGLLTGAPAATPSLSPAPGTYAGTQQVILADTTPGAVIHYTTDGTTPTSASATYVSGTPLAVSATETVQAIAIVSGYANSAVAGGLYTISVPAAPAAVSVALSAVANVAAIGQLGTAVPSGGLDGHGNAYATGLLGTTLTWSGMTFTLGTADSLDAVSRQTVALPSGSYSSILLLGTGFNGNQPNQNFVVTYTDGTTTTLTQSLSDWGTPQKYAGESIVSTMPYRLASSGAAAASTFYLYGYSLPLNAAKTVKSIAMPNNRNVVILAMDLVPATSAPTTPSTPTNVSLTASADVAGIGTIGTAVTGGGLDTHGYAYPTNLLGTSLTWSGATFSFGAAGVGDAVANTTVTLPAGAYGSIRLLATGVNGSQTGQTVVVTYTDGTTTSVTQSFSDWVTPQSYAGESVAATLAYRMAASGTQGSGPVHLYGYSFALNSAKTVNSITLPKNRNVVVLAIDLGQ
jgi:hypothetical protein